MVSPGGDERPARLGAEPGSAPEDLAAEAERARTPRTPFRALAGVWLTIAVVVAVLLVVAFTLYFAYDG